MRRSLIQYQVAINKKQLHGETVLHEVVRHTTQGNIGIMKEIIRLLRKAGANMNATNKAGKRPVDLVEEAISNLQNVEAKEFIQLLKKK